MTGISNLEPTIPRKTSTSLQVLSSCDLLQELIQLCMRSSLLSFHLLLSMENCCAARCVAAATFSVISLPHGCHLSEKNTHNGHKMLEVGVVGWSLTLQSLFLRTKLIGRNLGGLFLLQFFQCVAVSWGHSHTVWKGFWNLVLQTTKLCVNVCANIAHMFLVLGENSFCFWFGNLKEEPTSERARGLQREAFSGCNCCQNKGENKKPVEMLSCHLRVPLDLRHDDAVDPEQSSEGQPNPRLHGSVSPPFPWWGWGCGAWPKKSLHFKLLPVQASAH